VSLLLLFFKTKFEIFCGFVLNTRLFVQHTMPIMRTLLQIWKK